MKILKLLGDYIYQLYQKQEREAALLVKKQRTYSILEADDEDVDTDAPSTAASSHSTKENSKRKRFRRTNNADTEEDAEEARSLFFLIRAIYVFIIPD